jgi:hypothetical protein
LNWCTRFCSYNNDARADADVCRLLHSIGCLLRQTGCHVHLVRPYTYSSGGNRGGNSRPHLSSSGRGYLRSRDRPLGAQDRHSFEVKPRGPEWQRPYFRCMICGTGLWQKSGSNRAARTFQGIAINRVSDQNAENNWSICVSSPGTADANTAARAALHVQSVLRRDYDLMTD